MGIYLNPGNIDFQRALNSEIYVDKTELIKYTNSKLFTEQQYICVSRPRRFGKSMAANMLTAYYSKGCDSKEMFGKYKIAQSDTFDKHLNKYNVIRLDIQKFANRTETVADMLKLIEKRVINELKQEYDIAIDDDMVFAVEQIYNRFSHPFIFIIDEWDCVLRDKNNDELDKKQYLKFLCALFKGQSYIALAYMTGILPIKKYGGQSEINMFTEITMTNPRELSEFTGFTEDEVKELCEQYDMPYEETKRWYNGYNLKGISIYNPRSVIMSMTGHDFDNYWTSTETYEALKDYIGMNFDGLKDTIINLLAGQKAVIDTTTFTNDMVTFSTKDDVLTLLIHLGYLTYNFSTKEVYIPNYEVSEQFVSTIKVIGWLEVEKALKQSDELLKATLKGEEEKVAEMIEIAHCNNVSIIQYNDENSLSCVLSLAYYSAQKNYSIYREMPSGEGYADLIFVPRRNCSDPAMIVELKWNKSVETAITQIKNRKYAESLQDYSGEILLVGISYEKEKGEKQKKHICKIEKISK